MKIIIKHFIEKILYGFTEQVLKACKHVLKGAERKTAWIYVSSNLQPSRSNS